MFRPHFLGVAAALTLIAFAPPVHAQDGVKPRPASPNAFRESLKVTPEQAKQLKAIDEKFRPRIEGIVAQYRPQREKLAGKKGAEAARQRAALSHKFLAEMQGLMAEYRKEADAVFTPEQRKKIASHQTEPRAKLPAEKKLRRDNER